MIEITAIDTRSLGDRAYLATDGSAALVIDPQRDFDRVMELAAERGVMITDVLETHIHNDYVTGGYALARATGAAYHVNAADQVTFQRTPVADGDVIEVGAMRLRALATPGHTFTHLSYALEEGGTVIAVFTGGSLLYGSTGRTDLLGAEHQTELARAQYGSARRLARELPDAASVCPTHGFGSFCAATQAGGTSSTIGNEKRVNPALTLAEAEFVETMLAGLDAYPAYYAHMGAANAAGPAAPDLSPPRRADAAELRRRIDAGEWVVDLRSRTAFAAGHLRGALNFELGDNFATYLGWLIPWGMPLTLIGSAAADVAAAQRELVRIGIDKLAAAAAGPAGRGPAASRWRHSVSRTSPGCSAPGTVVPWYSTCAGTASGRSPTSTARCTSRCMSSRPGSASFPAARCGCTARPATARRWPRRCWTRPACRWCSSTTSSRGRSRPGSAAPSRSRAGIR